MFHLSLHTLLKHTLGQVGDGEIEVESVLA